MWPQGKDVVMSETRTILELSTLCFYDHFNTQQNIWLPNFVEIVPWYCNILPSASISHVILTANILLIQASECLGKI